MGTPNQWCANWFRGELARGASVACWLAYLDLFDVLVAGRNPAPALAAMPDAVSHHRAAIFVMHYHGYMRYDEHYDDAGVGIHAIVITQADNIRRAVYHHIRRSRNTPPE